MIFGDNKDEYDDKENGMKKLSGITVPIITPFNEDGDIDVESVKKLTDYVIDSRLTCLYPCGTTGEMMMLSISERKLIAETVVKEADHQVPVFIHVGAMNYKDTMELARHAVEIGADGIGVVTPAFFKLSDRELVEYYTKIAQNLPHDFSVYLYAIPQNAVNDINPSVAAAVADRCDNVVGIKYSYPNVSRMQQFMLIRNGDFSVLTGPDDLFHVVCAAGGDGTVSGNAQIIPEHYTALWDAIRSGDNEKARHLQRKTNVLNNILCAKNNIAAYKAVLKNEGIISNSSTRCPMKPYSEQETEDLMKELEDHDFRSL